MVQDADEQSTRVTNAVLRNELKHLADLLQDNCQRIRDEQRETTVQLKALNGTVRENREMLIGHNQRLANLEQWRDGLVKSAVQWLTLGLGIGGGIGAVLFGAGKAAGWW